MSAPVETARIRAPMGTALKGARSALGIPLPSTIRKEHP